MAKIQGASLETEYGFFISNINNNEGILSKFEIDWSLFVWHDVTTLRQAVEIAKIQIT